MLYGLSAKKQSGKDLFLKIWNGIINYHHFESSELTDDEIMSIKENLDRVYVGGEFFERRYFAESLKKIICELFGCSLEDLESERFKESKLPECWEKYIMNLEEHKLEKFQLTYRYALQYIGTEMFRGMWNPDTWVISLMGKYDRHKNWMITDVRFPNECDAITERGGCIIRINRESNLESDNHESECALDNHEFAYTINNNFVFEDYARGIFKIMKAEKII